MKVVNGKCPYCGHRPPNPEPKPMELDRRLTWSLSAIKKTLEKIKSEQGLKAARAARRKLNEELGEF